MPGGFFLSMQAKGIPQVQAFLGKVAYGYKGIALQAVNNYLFNQLINGNGVPAYSYITREEAYGQTFQSDAQRRYVMANIAQGNITPGSENRDGSITGAWQQSVSQGTKSTIYNTNPKSFYVYDDEQQANLNSMVGWPTISKFLEDNISDAVEYAQGVVSAWAQEGASGTPEELVGMAFGL